MEFPDPPEIGRHERSVAERHRILALVCAVGGLLPVGLVVSMVIDNPLLRLVVSFLVAYALLFGFVRLLRRRYLDIVSRGACVVRPTARQPRRSEGRVAHLLTTHGFSIVSTVVICTADGVVLTRPIIVLERRGDALTVDVGMTGATVTTLLDDDTWLRTTAAPSVSHARFRTNRVGMDDALAIVDAHTIELERLRTLRIAPAEQPGPLEVVAAIEELERETLLHLQSGGNRAPSAKQLTAPLG